MLLLAAFIAAFTAFAHLSCIFLGPECYGFQMAPEAIVESARNGTLVAPFGTILVAAIFTTWALYALSGAQLIRRLPLLSLGIYTIAFLCIARGILGIQLWLRRAELVNDFANISNWLWFATGLLFLFGYRLASKRA